MCCAYMMRRMNLFLLACSAMVQISWSEPCVQLYDPLEWLYPDSAVGSVLVPGTIDDISML